LAAWAIFGRKEEDFEDKQHSPKELNENKSWPQAASNRQGETNPMFDLTQISRDNPGGGGERNIPLIPKGRPIP
jgi:hypothetical protein